MNRTEERLTLQGILVWFDGTHLGATHFTIWSDQLPPAIWPLATYFHLKSRIYVNCLRTLKGWQASVGICRNCILFAMRVYVMTMPEMGLLMDNGVRRRYDLWNCVKENLRHVLILEK